VEALGRHDEAAVIHFNLARYECHVGNLAGARGYPQAVL